MSFSTSVPLDSFSLPPIPRVPLARHHTNLHAFSTQSHSLLNSFHTAVQSVTNSLVHTTQYQAFLSSLSSADQLTQWTQFLERLQLDTLKHSKQTFEQEFHTFSTHQQHELTNYEALKWSEFQLLYQCEHSRIRHKIEELELKDSIELLRGYLKEKGYRERMERRAIRDRMVEMEVDWEIEQEERKNKMDSIGGIQSPKGRRKGYTNQEEKRAIAAGIGLGPTLEREFRKEMQLNIHSSLETIEANLQSNNQENNRDKHGKGRKSGHHAHGTGGSTSARSLTITVDSHRSGAISSSAAAAALEAEREELKAEKVLMSPMREIQRKYTKYGQLHGRLLGLQYIPEWILKGLIQSKQSQLCHWISQHFNEFHTQSHTHTPTHTHTQTDTNGMEQAGVQLGFRIGMVLIPGNRMDNTTNDYTNTMKSSICLTPVYSSVMKLSTEQVQAFVQYSTDYLTQMTQRKPPPLAVVPSPTAAAASSSSFAYNFTDYSTATPPAASTAAHSSTGSGSTVSSSSSSNLSLSQLISPSQCHPQSHSIHCSFQFPVSNAIVDQLGFILEFGRIHYTLAVEEESEKPMELVENTAWKRDYPWLNDIIPVEDMKPNQIASSQPQSQSSSSSSSSLLLLSSTRTRFQRLATVGVYQLPISSVREARNGILKEKIVFTMAITPSTMNMGNNNKNNNTMVKSGFGVLGAAAVAAAVANGACIGDLDIRLEPVFHNPVTAAAAAAAMNQTKEMENKDSASNSTGASTSASVSPSPGTSAAPTPRAASGGPVPPKSPRAGPAAAPAPAPLNRRGSMLNRKGSIVSPTPPAGLPPNQRNVASRTQQLKRASSISRPGAPGLNRRTSMTANARSQHQSPLSR